MSWSDWKKPQKTQPEVGDYVQVQFCSCTACSLLRILTGAPLELTREGFVRLKKRLEDGGGWCIDIADSLPLDAEPGTPERWRLWEPGEEIEQKFFRKKKEPNDATTI